MISPKQRDFLIRLKEQVIDEQLKLYLRHPTDLIQRQLSENITILNYMRQYPGGPSSA